MTSIGAPVVSTPQITTQTILVDGMYVLFEEEDGQVTIRLDPTDPSGSITILNLKANRNSVEIVARGHGTGF